MRLVTLFWQLCAILYRCLDRPGHGPDFIRSSSADRRFEELRRLSQPMIGRCDNRDFELIWAIINDGARAYKGVIPEDCWTEPYMSKEKLRHEIEQGVVFWGYEDAGTLVGVMGYQPVQDVILIRHAYVRTHHQKRGIGGRLLSHLRELAKVPVLIGTWADAVWAIRFYERHGFQIVPRREKDRLLRRYWTIPERQIETSVVLAESVAETRQPQQIGS